MLKHVFVLASLVAASLLAPAATSASAQPVITTPEQLWAIECGGQYECVSDVLLTEVEARTCLGYPHAEEAESGRRVEVRLTMKRCDDCQE
jgi:hypothetical protein